MQFDSKGKNDQVNCSRPALTLYPRRGGGAASDLALRGAPSLEGQGLAGENSQAAGAVKPESGPRGGNAKPRLTPAESLPPPTRRIRPRFSSGPLHLPSRSASAPPFHSTAPFPPTLGTPPPPSPFHCARPAHCRRGGRAQSLRAVPCGPSPRPTRAPASQRLYERAPGGGSGGGGMHRTSALSAPLASPDYYERLGRLQHGLWDRYCLSGRERGVVLRRRSTGAGSRVPFHSARRWVPWVWVRPGLPKAPGGAWRTRFSETPPLHPPHVQPFLEEVSRFSDFAQPFLEEVSRFSDFCPEV